MKRLVTTTIPFPLAQAPWATEVADLLAAYHVDPALGLQFRDATRRKLAFGANRLRQQKPRSAWSIVADQFESTIVLLLSIATVVSVFFGDYLEAATILAVILINAFIGFVTEIRAVRSMEALRRLGSVSAVVRRNGKSVTIPAENLVPGDIVLLESGDMITADIRLITSSKLQVNESMLTGESLPVAKAPAALDADIPLAEQKNMVFKGTAITAGSAEGLVVTTGMHTELGTISSLMEASEREETPLEQRLGRLGRKLVFITLLIATLLGVTGYLAGHDLRLIIETSVALAVATVPEGLPIVATVALARGMWRMARQNALIRQLAAVETLGSTNVILTDKTGTLTENNMAVVRAVTASGAFEVTTDDGGEIAFRGAHMPVSVAEKEILMEALQTGVLCNNASIETDAQGRVLSRVGDPTEVALLEAGGWASLHRQTLLETLPEVREEAFDATTQMMATFHQQGEGYRVAVKGAPEAVLQHCSHTLSAQGLVVCDTTQLSFWQDMNERMAAQGLRMLAVASKTVQALQAPPYDDLTLLGLIGLLDPPRAGVRESIQACQHAGINVVMVTGDQAMTAKTIAREVGLIDRDDEEAVEGKSLRRHELLSPQEMQRILSAKVIFRASPEHKLLLLELYQKQGKVVAMTGDGVNDAPALKRAHIGIAMGIRGTQVAKEAAAMVLQDDEFATIVSAIQQGRIIFANIRKFVLYLLSCNISEILVVALAWILSVPLPILPMQILFLNLVTDVFPALALGVGKGEAAVMQQPPRDSAEPFLTRGHWLAISGYGSAITLPVMLALGMGTLWLGMAADQAVTLSFLTLAFAQLWHVFTMRTRGSGIVVNDITQNRWIWGALFLCIGLLLMTVYVPTLASILSVHEPGLQGWLTILGMSLVPALIGQAFHVRVVRRGGKPTHAGPEVGM